MTSALKPKSEKLLKTVFGERWGDAWVCWKGNMYGKRVRDLRAGDLPDDADCYFSIALLTSQAVGRANENAERVMALVIDDIGTKIDKTAFEMFFPLEATWWLETSPGNWQAGFAIAGGLGREEYDALRAGMKRNAIWGHSDGIDAVHLFRLPQGSHTKREPAWRIAP